MAEPLKNIYGPVFFEDFTAVLKQYLPGFNKQHFLNQVFDRHWEAKALKQRIRHISTVLHQVLPGSYREQLELIRCLVAHYEKKKAASFGFIFFPDFIEQFGLEDPDVSLDAMEAITCFVSCEFAIRPFLLRYSDRVMRQLLAWSRHPHPHVRRLASEGCRPRLPWAMAVPELKKDPSPILPVLENLKNDESLFVRKSVANNLNDIAKDHPEVVAAIARKWKGYSAGTDWIVRHGCRTLLKKAHPSVYRLFGLNGAGGCTVGRIQLDKTRLRIGDRLVFSFELSAKTAAKLRIEYAIYYARARGNSSRKLFQLSEKTFPPGTHRIRKEQRFQDFTTRKHYPGLHKIAIVVNGKEMAEREFFLKG